MLRKKNKVGGITIPDTSLYYKSTGIKTVWYWHKNRHIDQRNRMESPEINPSLPGPLIFNNLSRSIKWSKNSLFIKWCWEIWTATCKKNETQPPTYTIYKNKHKMDKRLKYKSWHHKSLEENIGRKISDIWLSNIFTNMSPRARDIKERLNKWDLIKIKSFYTAK